MQDSCSSCSGSVWYFFVWLAELFNVPLPVQICLRVRPTLSAAWWTHPHRKHGHGPRNLQLLSSNDGNDVGNCIFRCWKQFSLDPSSRFLWNYRIRVVANGIPRLISPPFPWPDCRSTAAAFDEVNSKAKSRPSANEIPALITNTSNPFGTKNTNV